MKNHKYNNLYTNRSSLPRFYLVDYVYNKLQMHTTVRSNHVLSMNNMSRINKRNWHSEEFLGSSVRLTPVLCKLRLSQGWFKIILLLCYYRWVKRFFYSIQVYTMHHLADVSLPLKIALWYLVIIFFTLCDSQKELCLYLF